RNTGPRPVRPAGLQPAAACNSEADAFFPRQRSATPLGEQAGMPVFRFAVWDGWRNARFQKMVAKAARDECSKIISREFRKKIDLFRCESFALAREKSMKIHFVLNTRRT